VIKISDEKIAEISDKGRRDFESGQKSVILTAMSLFVLWRRLPPKWLAAAFVDAIMTDCKSWDEVFGRPPRRKKHWPGLLSKIRELKAQGVKGEALFKQAANELSPRRGWRTVRDAYYDVPEPERIFDEWVSQFAEAAKREAIRLPGGARVFPPEKYVALRDWVAAHPMPSLSEKKPRKKRRT